MSQLGSQVSELEGLQRSRDNLESWVAAQENAVAEMLKRPAKFRPEAAAADAAAAADLRQAVAEKTAVLDDIEARQAAAAAATAPDHRIRIALDTLDEHVRIFHKNKIKF